MKSDILRYVDVASRGNLSVVAAGETFNTYYLDTADTVGPVTFVAESSAANAQLSFTFRLEDATALPTNSTSAGTGNATVTRDNIVGGDATEGLGSDGELDVAQGDQLSHALSYNGSKRYVRAVLVVANASSATQNVAVSVTGMRRPQVSNSNR